MFYDELNNCINGDNISDFIEFAILHEVMRAYATNEECQVTNIIRMTHLASQATLFGRLKNLREKNYIKTTGKHDSRVRLLQPTTKSINLFQLLGAWIK